MRVSQHAGSPRGKQESGEEDIVPDTVQKHIKQAESVLQSPPLADAIINEGAMMVEPLPFSDNAAQLSQSAEPVITPERRASTHSCRSLHSARPVEVERSGTDRLHVVHVICSTWPCRLNTIGSLEIAASARALFRMKNRAVNHFTTCCASRRISTACANWQKPVRGHGKSVKGGHSGSKPPSASTSAAMCGIEAQNA